MEFYVIRHKPSQTLLPARVYATHFDFTIPGDVEEPRLFKTARAAKNCATCWAQGHWSAEIKTDSDGWEHPSYEYQDCPVPQPKAGRRREDLEVLKVELRLEEVMTTHNIPDAKRMSYELLGVITDVEEGHGFDAVCLATIQRVYDVLAAAPPVNIPPSYRDSHEASLKYVEGYEAGRASTPPVEPNGWQKFLAVRAEIEGRE